jgi:hypothetical protein
MLMNDRVGIWIDHRKAVIVTASADRTTVKTLESHSKALSKCIVGIETTDKLTDQQIVAKVKEHYGIDR